MDDHELIVIVGALGVTVERTRRAMSRPASVSDADVTRERLVQIPIVFAPDLFLQHVHLSLLPDDISLALMLAVDGDSWTGERWETRQSEPRPRSAPGMLSSESVFDLPAES